MRAGDLARVISKAGKISTWRSEFETSGGEFAADIDYSSGGVEVIVDHGALEVLANGTPCSMLIFAG